MANPPPPRMPPKPKQPVAPWRLKLGKAIPWLLGFFAVALLAQVYLAGIYVMASDYTIDPHVTLARVLELAILAIAVVGFVAADWRIGVLGLLFYAMVTAQYFLVANDDATGLVRGLHPANGVLMLVLALVFLMRRLPVPPRQAADGA